MKEICLTRGKVALVDNEDYEYINQWKWKADEPGKTGKFYASRTYKLNKKNKYISMHRVILNLHDSKIFVDHIDRNGLNNQKYNLREATPLQNACNRTKSANLTSKFMGVNFKKDRNKFRAGIKNQKKSIHLGYFENEIDAAKAYNEAAIKIHGSFASLNIL